MLQGQLRLRVRSVLTRLLLPWTYPAFYNPDENRVDELHLPARCVALDWVIIFSSSAVLISGYVLRVLLTSVGQSREGGQ
jgi:hypothetical protein